MVLSRYLQIPAIMIVHIYIYMFKVILIIILLTIITNALLIP